MPQSAHEVAEREDGSSDEQPVIDEGAEFWRSAPKRNENAETRDVDIAPAVPTGRSKMSRLEQLRAKNNSVWRPAVSMDRGPNANGSRRSEGKRQQWLPPYLACKVESSQVSSYTSV
jgi:hypothetical protein